MLSSSSDYDALVEEAHFGTSTHFSVITSAYSLVLLFFVSLMLMMFVLFPIDTLLIFNLNIISKRNSFRGKNLLHWYLECSHLLVHCAPCVPYVPYACGACALHPHLQHRSTNELGESSSSFQACLQIRIKDLQRQSDGSFRPQCSPAHGVSCHPYACGDGAFHLHLHLQPRGCDSVTALWENLRKSD